MQKTTRIAAKFNQTVAALLAQAAASPVLVAPSRLDTQSVVRKQTMPKMPIGQVLALARMCASHALQRNTLGRLENPAKTAYLRTSGEVPTPQQHVQFVFFNGRLEILDGNHRLTLWNDPGETTMVPMTVDVTLHYPATTAEYRQLYRCIDSSQSRKTNQDNLYGVFNAIGLTPQSPLFLSQKLVSAILFVTNRDRSQDGLLEGAEELKKELAMLDSFGFRAAPRVTYSSGVWAGLLTLAKDRKDPQRLLAFAQHLRAAREMPAAVLPQAVQDFIACYEDFDLPGAQGNIPKVRALVVASFEKFEQAFVSKRPKKVLKTVSKRKRA